jgi:hypothetical protein
MKEKDKNIIIGAVVILIIVIFGLTTFSGNDVQEKGIVEGTDLPVVSDSSVKITDNKQVVEVKNPKVAGDPQPLNVNRANNLCTFETVEDDVYTLTTSYVSGAQSRVDVISRNFGPGGPVILQLHTISNGIWSYTWETGDTVGEKESVSGSGLTVPQASGGAVLISEKSYATWDCHPWIPDQSKLTPPSYVTFL